MDKEWEKVLQFHRAFSVPAEEEPTQLSEDRVAARADWLMEEIEELREAQTLTEQADAMIDTIYLALGTLVEMGVKPEPLFDIVHSANMGKLWEDGKPRYRTLDGKVIKPPTWIDPDPLLQAELNRQKTQNSKKR